MKTPIVLRGQHEVICALTRRDREESLSLSKCRCTHLPCLVTIISLVWLWNWRHLCSSWSAMAAAGSTAGIPDDDAMVADADAGLYILRYTFGLRTTTCIKHIHSFIYSGHFYSASLSPLIHIGAPDYIYIQHGYCIGVSRWNAQAAVSEGLVQGLNVAARAGVEPRPSGWESST